MRSSRLLVSTLLVTVVSFSLVSCGDSEADSASSTPATGEVPGASTGGSTATTAGDAVPSPSVPPKPEVKIPAELPTELVVTDLSEGAGPAAAAGDTVVVHYVGVRSADGTEFDNSYDRGEPFPVVLGAGSVIQGWDQGLIGAKQGGQRQLDIPADLAYGDSPQGGVIQAGDALTFVVDVIAVIPVVDPSTAPDIAVEGASNQEKIDIADLVVGEGAEVQPGQTAVLHLVAYRADTGEQLDSTWETAQTFSFVLGTGDAIPGLELGIEAMHVGGRRQVVVPYILAFGDAGNPDLGLPEKTDMVLVLDLIAAY
ncbi:MAG: peptidyl-prolyl cis-trans isomerase [Acidimicrobiaceae bacterium]|nr:MAG: peptidyl-prolyl cis-trans isomerase [Acidimicrobiaceae bacterium]